MILAVLEKELVLGLAPRCFPKHNGWHFGRWSRDRFGCSCCVYLLWILQWIKIFVLLAKWDFQVKFVRKPSGSAHSRSRKTRVFDHFCIKYNKITLKNTGIQIRWS
jgi:hypothetical protein